MLGKLAFAVLFSSSNVCTKHLHLFTFAVRVDPASELWRDHMTDEVVLNYGIPWSNFVTNIVFMAIGICAWQKWGNNGEWVSEIENVQQMDTWGGESGEFFFWSFGAIFLWQLWQFHSGKSDARLPSWGSLTQQTALSFWGGESQTHWFIYNIYM